VIFYLREHSTKIVSFKWKPLPFHRHHLRKIIRLTFEAAASEVIPKNSFSVFTILYPTTNRHGSLVLPYRFYTAARFWFMAETSHYVSDCLSLCTCNLHSVAIYAAIGALPQRGSGKGGNTSKNPWNKITW
jgi:hypothetical protein